MAGRAVRNVVLPARGEFGLRIRYHVPAVHALPRPKAVYHEEGEEALYPSADETVVVPRIDDDRRAGTHPRSDVEFRAECSRDALERFPGAMVLETSPEMPQSWFTPSPVVMYGIDPDVVVCPRRREYGSAKNWDAWPHLIRMLNSGGLRVYAAGAPDSSYEVDCPAAWHRARFLDASIEAMINGRLVVATDAGLAHLAMLCGADLLLVTYRGLVAPGPVIDSSGEVAHETYWPVRLDEYYRQANHAGARIEVIDGWEDPGRVGRIVQEWCR